MPVSPLSALSPLDGRYAGKVEALRPLLSEFGLMRRRVQVEVEWFIALSDAGFAEFKPLGRGRARLPARPASTRFSRGRRRRRSRTIERTTNHDVKAVEYWLEERIAGDAELARGRRVRPLRLHQRGHQQHQPCADAARRRASEVLLPALDARRSRRCATMAHALRRRCRCSARTHGQTASPTTLGKEIANVAARLAQARAAHRRGALLAKMNGAVGNYNAHLAAYPEFDWEAFARRVVEERLGLAFNPLHDPDRAARRHGRAVRRGHALPTRS